MTDNEAAWTMPTYERAHSSAWTSPWTPSPPDRTVASMPVEGNTQPYGCLHGGASAALAETVGSLAAMAHAGPGKMAVGVDLNITHHRR